MVNKKTKTHITPEETIKNLLIKRQIQPQELGFKKDEERSSLEIIIDGIDGSGKTKISGELYELLQTNVAVEIVDDGNADPFYEARQIYKRTGVADHLSLFLVKSGGRREALLRTAQQLREPVVRIHDRGYGSQIAEYLASELGNGNNNNTIKLSKEKTDKISGSIRRIAQTYIVADLHIILDCDPTIAARRIDERYKVEGRAPDRSEKEETLKLRSAYHLLCAKFLPNAHRIEVSQNSPRETANEIITKLELIEKYTKLPRRS